MNPDEEIQRLRGCINDLVSILALPVIWSGRDPALITGVLLDALLRMLRLDFVYARVNAAPPDPPVEAVRVAPDQQPTPTPAQVGHSLERWLGVEPPSSGLVIPNPVGKGEVSIARS